MELTRVLESTEHESTMVFEDEARQLSLLVSKIEEVYVRSVSRMDTLIETLRILFSRIAFRVRDVKAKMPILSVR